MVCGEAVGCAGLAPRTRAGQRVDDLVRGGEVPSPYYGRASRECEWVSERAWVYRRRLPRGGRIRFGGVDFASTIFANGEEVGRHEGCFAPFEVDVPDGAQLLAVVIHPAPESEPQVGRTSRVRVHKPRMNYGWDFCPRLVHQGIWRPVTLDPEPARFPVVRLENGVGTVELDGEIVLRVDEPTLWWPNGLGEQHLYEAEGFGVGFRTVELDDFRLLLNGVAMPIRGWNWVPVDVLYGVPRPEKVAHLLELAAAAGVNVIRVWGGGLLETDEFYEHCDRLGLLVWQEFSQSSSGIETSPRTTRASWRSSRKTRVTPSLASAGTPRSRTGAAATSSTQTAPSPRSSRSARSSRSSIPAAPGSPPRRRRTIATCTGLGAPGPARASGALRVARRRPAQ